MKKILLLLTFTISISLMAQLPLTLEISPSHSTYNVLYPANFNPDDPNLQPDLFRVSVLGVSTLNAVLYCELTWENSHAEATLIPDVPGQFPTNFSSSEIINNSPMGFSIEQNFDDFLDDIENLILDTGRMPDGNYVFNLRIFENDQNGIPLSNLETVVITIRSPISISLITPGNPIGLGVTNIAEPYPNFIWFSNLDNYTIKIYELDGVYETVEDIELLDPLYVETEISGTSFIYPPSAPEFEYNTSYAWQVSATVTNPIVSAESIYKSTMYLFKLSNTGAEELDMQILRNFLTQLNVEGIDEVIRLLEAGYVIENLFWQGREITAEELVEILEDISAGIFEVKNLTIE